jgi:hypothetical protein
MIELACRTCGAPVVPTREDVLRGPAWYRHCPSCRGAIIGSPALSPAESPTTGPRVCPRCHRVVKSGRHRHGPCPGRPRRSGRSRHERPVA